VKVGEEFFVRCESRNTARSHPTDRVVDLLPGGVEPVLELARRWTPQTQE